MIDFERFKNRDEQEVRKRLIIKNIVGAVADLARKAGKKFDGQCLIADILNLFSLTPQEIERP